MMEMLTDMEHQAVIEGFTKNPNPKPMEPKIRVRHVQGTNDFGVFQSGKISAIKAVRTMTGCGLKEAKDFVEGYEPLYVSRDTYNALSAVFYNNVWQS